MTIQIEDLKFQTIIGILDFERQTPQDVIINIKIEYDYIEEFINYADVASLVKTTMIELKFLLIEDALKDLSQKLQKNFPDIKTLNLKITKPSILPDCKVSVANSYKFNS
ncbi:FolB domain-containing protein [Sulfurimonas aquatica]|uniref:dihydroneopterin aldolase n=1 Tax=Sulfurimonas aquatica TaxID=2672570 RepID=A0A975AZC7_9BACT|nr:dihydroneopterin aldolase [Sulfurimonas aquatica]QSZ41283.1 FolB domain-containing protein [Sulfurimonas aquatica]